MSDFTSSSESSATEPPPVSNDAVLSMVQHGEEAELRAVLLALGNRYLSEDISKSPVNTIKDWAGDALLAIAAWHERLDLMKLLLAFGAEVNARNGNGSTALHRACHKNNVAAVQLLLAHGADYTIRDRSGRLPAEVGDATVKAAIDHFARKNKLDFVSSGRASPPHNPMLQAASAEERQVSASRERARRRAQQAVPVVLFGASNARLNGTYEPIDEIINEWPVYSLRGDRDVWMVLVGNEWVIQLTPHKGSPSHALVRMTCLPHCWPELRTDGANGITEYSEVLGILVKSSKRSHIGIVTEAEAAGQRASQMFKLEEHDLRGSVGSYGSNAAHTSATGDKEEEGVCDPTALAMSELEFEERLSLEDARDKGDHDRDGGSGGGKHSSGGRMPSLTHTHAQQGRQNNGSGEEPCEPSAPFTLTY